MPLPILPAWLESLAATSHLHRLGWVVLHSLWQAAVLAVALRLLPRRTAFGQEARYLLATLALFSLPVACAVTWTLVEPTRLPTCAAVWLTGALAAALRLVVGWSLTRRLVATAAPFPTPPGKPGSPAGQPPSPSPPRSASWPRPEWTCRSSSAGCGRS